MAFLVHDATPVCSQFLQQLVKPLEDPEVAAAYGRQIARQDATPIERHFLERTYGAHPSVKRRNWTRGPDYETSSSPTSARQFGGTFCCVTRSTKRWS